MFKVIAITIVSSLLSTFSYSQLESTEIEPSNIVRDASLVDYEAFLTLVNKVQSHRQERLISLEKFNTMSTEENTIILDTRTKEMYDAKHVKGAIHLNFSAFTQENLENLIPNKETRILIYCNNNFEDDPIYFITKGYTPPVTIKNDLGIAMALNIPTYINLYGYGYREVYELKDLISVNDQSVKFEGSSVSESNDAIIVNDLD